MISGPTLSGQPCKAVGHAVGKLTLRHDLAEVVKDRRRWLHDKLETRANEAAARPVKEFVTSEGFHCPPYG